MRIGVLTHSGTDDNYGQILQCFALQNYLKGLGHDAFLIKYSSDTEIEQECCYMLKWVARFIISLVSPSRRRTYDELKYYKKLRELNTEKNKLRAFKKFVSDNLALSPIHYLTFSELIANAPEADAYIVGSDQVWNLNLLNPIAAAWYLQFGKKNTLRIAYAASIGRNITESEKKQFAEYLKEFDAISVRERSACKLCQELGFKETQIVLDPTVLVPFSVYRPFIEEEVLVKKPYVFLYYLNIQTAEETEWTQLEQFLIQRKLALKSVSSSGYFPAQNLIPGHPNEYLTIQEWLTAIYNAEYVVSTSFHGIVFALLMHKPFVAIPLRNQYKSGNDRIISLLKTLHLENRIISEDSTLAAILDEPIDWKQVDMLLTEERKESFEFLNNALEK